MPTMFLCRHWLKISISTLYSSSSDSSVMSTCFNAASIAPSFWHAYYYMQTWWIFIDLVYLYQASHTCPPHTRAPIVAMWADRFSRYCWRRFSRSRVSINPTPSTCQLFYHLCSTPSLLPSCHRGKGEGVGYTELTWATLSAKRLRLQQLDCHWGELLIESRPWLLLLRAAPLWPLVIFVIAHWMRCSITY